MNIKRGTKFTVGSFDDLEKNGWTQDSDGDYIHPDFSGCMIISHMIKNNEGKTLTVRALTSWANGWYSVHENSQHWPVATFLSEESSICLRTGHLCEQGMTPIDGWIICKICGVNLFTVKMRSQSQSK